MLVFYEMTKVSGQTVANINRFIYNQQKSLAGRLCSIKTCCVTEWILYPFVCFFLFANPSWKALVNIHRATFTIINIPFKYQPVKQNHSDRPPSVTLLFLFPLLSSVILCLLLSVIQSIKGIVRSEMLE